MALSRTDTIDPSDLVTIWKTSDGDYRAAVWSMLMEYIQANISVPGAFVTEYASPSATGFSVALSGSDDIHLILTPVAGYAAGTLTLPALAGLIDGQRVLVNCTQAVTTLTIAANGATAVVGAPTTLAANAFFMLKYDAVAKTWYRVG
jgi:hypothetical protein